MIDISIHLFCFPCIDLNAFLILFTNLPLAAAVFHIKVPGSIAPLSIIDASFTQKVSFIWKLN